MPYSCEKITDERVVQHVTEALCAAQARGYAPERWHLDYAVDDLRWHVEALKHTRRSAVALAVMRWMNRQSLAL